MEELEKGHKIKLKFTISSVRSAEIECTIKRLEQDRISLDFPENAESFAKYLHEGKEMEVVIYSDKGIYLFDSVVIDSPFERDFVIEFPEEKQKVQRREYVRVPNKLRCILAKGDKKIETETINVGGGGIRFKANSEFKIADKWGFYLYLPRWPSPSKGFGEILYTIKQDNSMISVIKFTDIDESDRNKIIKFCFEEEALRLKMRTNMTNNLLS